MRHLLLRQLQCHTPAIITSGLTCAVQVKAEHVRIKPLAAEGGASGVGASIADYVESCDADMVVLGSRGLHGWHRCVHSAEVQLHNAHGSFD